MPTLQDSAQQFLAQRRIAVAGVARRGDTAANAIFKKLRSSGYEVFPVNPNADTIDGVRCYPALAAIPGGVDAVVIGTPAHAAMELVRECGELGIRHVWFHRAIGQGSFDAAAVQRARELGITVIPGGCPMMFCEPVDVPHKCLRWYLNLRGKLPEEEPASV
jgi:uncharacterized protein